jgi:hypothetical protein
MERQLSPIQTLEDAEQYWRYLIVITQQIIEAVHSHDWERLAQGMTKREEMMAALDEWKSKQIVERGERFVWPADWTHQYGRVINEMDGQLRALLEQGRQEAKEQLAKLRLRKQAAGRYNNSTALGEESDLFYQGNLQVYDSLFFDKKS